MPDLIQSIVTLLMLILLQAVLGFDNLLYISLESKRAPVDKQRKVRLYGIGIAVALRIILLLVLLQMVEKFTSSWGHFNWGFMEGDMNFTGLIRLFGGVFILYTAVK